MHHPAQNNDLPAETSAETPAVSPRRYPAAGARKLVRTISTAVATALIAPLVLVVGASGADAADYLGSPNFYPRKSGMYTSVTTCGSQIDFKGDYDAGTAKSVSAKIEGFGSTQTKTFTPITGGRTYLAFERDYLAVGTYSPKVTINGSAMTWAGSETPKTLTVTRAPVTLTTSVTKTWSAEAENYVFDLTRSGDGPSTWPLKVIVEELDGTKLDEVTFPAGTTKKSIKITKFTEDARNIRIRAVEESSSCGTGSKEVNIPGYIHRVAVNPTFTQTDDLYHNTATRPVGVLDLGNSSATGTVTFRSGYNAFIGFQTVDVVNGKATLNEWYSGIAPLAGLMDVEYSYSGDKYLLPYASGSTIVGVRKATSQLVKTSDQPWVDIRPDQSSYYEFNIKTESGASPGATAVKGLSLTGLASTLYGGSFSYNSSNDTYRVTFPKKSLSESDAIKLSNDDKLWQSFKIKWTGDDNHTAQTGDLDSQTIYIMPWVRYDSTLTVNVPTSGKAYVPLTVSARVTNRMDESHRGKFSITFTDPNGTKLNAVTFSPDDSGNGSVPFTPTMAGDYSYQIQYVDGVWSESTSVQTGTMKVSTLNSKFSVASGIDLDYLGNTTLNGRLLTELGAGIDGDIEATVSLAGSESDVQTVRSDANGNFSLSLTAWPSFAAPGSVTLRFAGSDQVNAQTATVALNAPLNQKWTVNVSGDGSVSSGESFTAEIHVPAAEGTTNESVDLYQHSLATKESTFLETLPLSNGRASFTSTFPVGEYSLRVDYKKTGQTTTSTAYHDITVVKSDVGVTAPKSIEASRKNPTVLSGSLTVQEPRTKVTEGTVTATYTLADGTAESVQAAVNSAGGFELNIPAYLDNTPSTLQLSYGGSAQHVSGPVGDPITIEPDSSKEKVAFTAAITGSSVHGAPYQITGATSAPQFPAAAQGTFTAFEVRDGKETKLASAASLSELSNLAVAHIGASAVRVQFESNNHGESASVTIPVTVTPAEATITAPAVVNGSLFSPVTVPGTLAFVSGAESNVKVSYSYNYADSSLDSDQKLKNGSLSISNGTWALAVPALALPVVTPESVTFSVEHEGVAARTITVPFNQNTAHPLSLSVPTTLKVLQEGQFTATVVNGPEDSDISGVFELFTVVGGTETVLDSVTSATGSATFTTALPGGKNHVGVRFTRDGEVVAEFLSNEVLEVERIAAQLSGANTHELSATAATTYSGSVAPASGTSASVSVAGTLDFVLEANGSKTWGSAQVQANGEFTLSVPKSSASSAGTLTITYSGNNDLAPVTRVVATEPDAALVESSVALQVPATTTFGKTVTLTATVSAASKTASIGGSVQFREITTSTNATSTSTSGTSTTSKPLGTVTIDSTGKASLTIKPTIGVHTYQAVYGGHALVGSSTSTSAPARITTIPVAVTASSTRPAAGDTSAPKVTFTATADSGYSPFTGVISYTVGSTTKRATLTPIGNGTQFTATASITGLTPGDHVVSYQFIGGVPGIYSVPGVQRITVSQNKAASTLPTASVLSSLKVSVSGKAKVGSTLTAKITANVTPTSVTYQWYSNGSKISGATKKTYKVTPARAGKKLSVKVSARKFSKTLTTSSAKTSKIAKVKATLKVNGPKTVKFSKTASFKVTLKASGVTSAKGTIKVKVGSKTLSKKVTKPGTYTFKIKAKSVGKGKKKVTASFTSNTATKKFLTAPKKATTTVTIK